MQKLKVIPGWRIQLLKLVGQGHNVKAACVALKVGYDRVLSEKRRDVEFGAELDGLIESNAGGLNRPKSLTGL